jgi:hypothetical protein
MGHIGHESHYTTIWPRPQIGTYRTAAANGNTKGSGQIPSDRLVTSRSGFFTNEKDTQAEC